MNLYELSVEKASKMLKDKEISSVELTNALLDRIDEKDKSIEGYITVAKESALNSAMLADEKIKNGEKYDFIEIMA